MKKGTWANSDLANSRRLREKQRGSLQAGCGSKFDHCGIATELATSCDGALNG